MKELDLNSNYVIYRDGKIFSKYVNRYLKISVDTSGYYRVKLKCEGKDKKFLLHRLLALSFISNPENKEYVNHLDGNKLNNNLYNLEWCTSTENQKHAYLTGLKTNRGEINPKDILTEDEVIVIYNKLLKGGSVKAIADSYNVSKSTISSIKSKQNWAYLLEELPDCTFNNKTKNLNESIVHTICKHFEMGLKPKEVQTIIGSSSATLDQLYGIKRKRGFKDILKNYNW